MKNVEIIAMETMFRVEAGELPEGTILNTWKGWERLGYKVKHGETHVAEFKIWMPSAKKKTKEEEEAEQNGEVTNIGRKRFYKKLSYFFTQAQVKPI